jgi:antitoxin VapB
MPVATWRIPYWVLPKPQDRIYCTYIRRELTMETARVFRSGNSQAVRLPKQFRLKSKEVEIFRRGDEIVLREKKGSMVRAFDLLAGLPEDFEIPGRRNDRPQRRKGV